MMVWCGMHACGGLGMLPELTRVLRNVHHRMLSTAHTWLPLLCASSWAGSFGTQTVTVYDNRRGTPVMFVPRVIATSVAAPRSLFAADGDGLVDGAVASWTEGRVLVLEQNTVRTVTATSSAPYVVHVVDVGARFARP
jgi:hypothetical protein